jgi:hypothetical protein
MPVDPQSPIEEFEQIAAQVPVFHITTDQAAPEPPAVC